MRTRWQVAVAVGSHRSTPNCQHAASSRQYAGLTSSTPQKVSRKTLARGEKTQGRVSNPPDFAKGKDGRIGGAYGHTPFFTEAKDT